MRLTQRIVEHLVCEPGRRDRLVFDDVQRGLAVRVTATGGRSYLAQYTLGGQKRRVPLGSCAALSLADAREAARAIAGEIAKGADPAAFRRARVAANRAAAERERMTLGTLVDTWADLHLSGKRVRYAREAPRALHHAFDAHWSAPAEDLTRAAVVRVLDKMVKAGRLAMAGRTAAYGRACFTWAEKRGTLAVNPFASLPSTGARPTRDRVLADAELAMVWRAAAADGGVIGSIVKLLILTGQRREEVAGMAWAELSPDRATWTLDGRRTKNGVQHVVPLSAPAQDIIRAMPATGSPLVLPGDTGGPFGGWSRAKGRLDARIATERAKLAGDGGGDHSLPSWTLHDLRRTLATGLQRLGVRLEVTEAILNHISGSRAGIIGVYQRHDWQAEKRAALDAWSAHVLAIVEGHEPAATVVQLAARR